jgi:prolipoprotein diacylglyceryl transferase
MIALGVVAGVWLAGRRMEAAGVGTRDDMSSIAVWAVAAGVLGARLYYIVTDKSQPWKEPSRWLQVWKGGLGIPGGLLFGIVVALWAAKRRGISPGGLFTAAAPALPLAQAIGRIGNWWNQELFGRPTKLPWALEIDAAHVPDGYAVGTTFHPTFLYEMLWNLALCGVLILIGKKVRLRPGRLLAIYVVGYFTGRFWIEGLRIDPANFGGGWRLNQWTAVFAVGGAVVYLLVDKWMHRADSEPDIEPEPDGDTESDTESEPETEPETESETETESGAEPDIAAEADSELASDGEGADDYVSGDE